MSNTKVTKKNIEGAEVVANKQNFGVFTSTIGAEPFERGDNGKLSLFRNSLTLVSTFLENFYDYSAGSSFGVALDYSGNAWTWESNSAGQLGDNTTTSRSGPVLVVGGHSFISVAAGADHSLALKSNGEVWGWGYQVWNPNTNLIQEVSSPILITTGCVEIFEGAQFIRSVNRDVNPYYFE